MKILREHINEIKRDISGTGLGAIGIGRASINKKLKEHIREDFNYIHALHHDSHGEYIAKLLKLNKEEIIECGFRVNTLSMTEYIYEYLDILLDLFRQCDLHFTKVQRGPYNEKEQNFKNKIEYYIWKVPSFVVEIKPEKESTSQINLYCNKNVFE